MSKIIIIAIICIFLTSALKSYNNEIATIISVCGGVLIFLLVVDEMKNIFEYFISLYDMTGLNFDFLSVILKIVGIGYIVNITSRIIKMKEN